MIQVLRFDRMDDMLLAIEKSLLHEGSEILPADESGCKGYVVFHSDENGIEIGTHFLIELNKIKALSEKSQQIIKNISERIAKDQAVKTDVSDRILVFVDGELYKGRVIFGNYKGIGWPGGRAAEIFLEKKLAARFQDVSIVYLSYGKLRHCKYNPNGMDLKQQLKEESTCWTVFDMPSDVDNT